MLKSCISFLNSFKGRNNLLLYRNASQALEKKRICIVGSGPAGFYTAQQLLKSNLTEVDIFEKLPVPFGLIRYGVAPDHPEIKNVCNGFTKVALRDQCNFYGNINVGRDIKLSELLDSYHAVVLAFGANYDKELNIPGENSRNVFPARKLVGWYTGHPDYINELVDLDTEVVTVIGQGNVAVDVSRILLRDVDELKGTDISENALETLRKSRVKRVVMIGRRGPLQVSFTIKEFRELSKLQGVQVLINNPIVEHLYGNADELQLSRIHKRMMELMHDLYKKNASINSSEKCLEVKFFRTPKEIVSDGNGKVSKMIFNVNEMKEVGNSKNSKVEVTSAEDVVECGLVVRSVGYKGLSIDPLIHFDENKNRLPNKGGRILDKEGLYCSGWVKTGPVGVIVSTMNSSFETGQVILQDIQEGRLSRQLSKSRDDVFNLLKTSGVKIVTFEDWQKIDSYEIEKGELLGKLREKMCNVEEMLRCVGKS